MISRVVRDEREVAWIDQDNIKVIEVVLDYLAYGWSADSIHEQHPHLTGSELAPLLTYRRTNTSRFSPS